jgi:multicomponent K+:H+ antiporter subunit C
MEEVIAIAIGVLAASGVWLILRPDLPGGHGPVPAVLWRQPVHLQHGQPVHRQGADHQGRRAQDLLHYTDPLPQALVLTAIVISFAMTALFLVVLLASRGLTGTDHVDGREPKE